MTETAGDMHSVVERRLRRIDQRYTSGRRAIIELLVSVGHPVSIGDIAQARPGLPRTSAYRHLTDLHAAGLVCRVSGCDEITRLELADDLTHHPPHPPCCSCRNRTHLTPPS